MFFYFPLWATMHSPVKQNTKLYHLGFCWFKQRWHLLSFRGRFESSTILFHLLSQLWEIDYFFIPVSQVKKAAGTEMLSDFVGYCDVSDEARGFDSKSLKKKKACYLENAGVPPRSQRQMNNKGCGRANVHCTVILQECIDKFFRVRHQMNLLHCPCSEFPKNLIGPACVMWPSVESKRKSFNCQSPECEKWKKSWNKKSGPERYYTF